VLSPRPWWPTRFIPSFQSRSHEGQAVGARGEPAVDRAQAMLEERGLLPR
jgi:hypothetical protein